ncbi:Sodium-dependent nutrient amino acid transporter 1 [Folsomia candida]|uniref:Transporter n=1 Tax=Folsomia candida TaxID=158441 RepID=A0A226EE51_FOLCA|nr:Sodium-dependent nutrient amino acid transporter 1 [Folsomia candida]
MGNETPDFDGQTPSSSTGLNSGGGMDNPTFIADEPHPDYVVGEEFTPTGKGAESQTPFGGAPVTPSEPPPDYDDTFTSDRDSPVKSSYLSNQNLGPGQISYQDGKEEPHRTMWGAREPEDPSEAGAEDGRDTWDNPIEFLLSCISMSVGLGNVWRFPFVAYSNGGGAFLIPYLVVLLLIGRPIYYLEMCMGQFSRYGQVKVWAMAPLFKGIGYGAMVGTICVVSYYCSIMAQTIFYLASSFQNDLPWSVCNKNWGGVLCMNDGTLNSTANVNNRSIADLFYTMEAFPVKNSIDDGLGSPEWRLSLCLLFAWILIFLSLWKGVKSSGKVAYFTAIFPYVVMLILLIRGVTLKGAGKGILYFIEPQWEKLYDPKVWYEAVSQCFFSLSTGFGPIIMFSSYNPFKHNVYRDALIISFMDTFTSLLAGCTIFAVLGYLSEAPGGGLAFVTYPEALSSFPVPQLFAVLFFLMLFTLGIGSATSLAGGVITIICDQFPKFLRWQVTLIVCIVGFFSGLMYLTPGGNFMVDLVNEFGANFVIYVIAMLEVGAVSWVYGLSNFCNDIEFMLNRKVGWYWRVCWGFIIPVGLFAILVYYMVTRETFKSGGVEYPNIGIICGWLLSAFAILLVPAFGLHSVLTRKAGTFSEKFMESLKPSKHWGPQNPRLRKEWLDFKSPR